jgi:hypothetical protein
MLKFVKFGKKPDFQESFVSRIIIFYKKDGNNNIYL